MFSTSPNFSSKLTPLVGEFPGVEGQIWVDSEQHVVVLRSTNYTGLDRVRNLPEVAWSK